MAQSRGRRRVKSPPSTNLPDIPSTFVGRTADIAAIERRLDQGRLVTVTGPGGIGKTRVALRVAQERLVSYRAHRGGGVWLSDLTHARSFADIVAVVAAAIGAPVTGGSDVVIAKEVGNAIARMGRVLLIVDNFDRLISEASATVGVWLAVAPQAHFLVTSRMALGLPGEQLWPLQPLLESEGAELFTRRASQVRPSFDGAGSERDVVLGIVRALDGLPLAIELAATRMAVLSAPQLRERLDRPLRILEGGDGRHASMRRTVLDSVELLSKEEARLFSACAIFRNGFTLEAAEAVLGGPVVAPNDVLHTLDSLVRRSLLRTVFSPGDDEGGARFAFFEIVREVADELLLEEKARDELKHSHVAYYAELCDRLGHEATIRSGGSAFARLGREFDNLTQAHATALKEGPSAAKAAVAIALGLDPLLSARGSSALRLQLLDASIAQLGQSTFAASLTEALLARGLAWRELGDLTRARADFERGLSLATRTGSPGLAAQALTRIGEVTDVEGSTTEARGCFAKALDLLRRAPDDALRSLREAEAFVRLGHALRREGELDAARAATSEAVIRYRVVGHDEGLAGALYEAAVVAMFRHDDVKARSLFDEGLSVARRVGVRAIAGALTTARGSLLQGQGAIDEALAHHAEAARLFREIGSPYREASALYYLGTAYLERDDLREAELMLRRARECVKGVGSPRYEALIDAARACVLCATGDLAAAAAVFDHAARAGALCPSEPALTATLSIHRLSLGVRLGQIDSAQAVSTARALSSAHPSDDSHFALRVLLSVVGPTQPRPEVALVVWAEGCAFRMPLAADRIALSPRSPARRILWLLARRRIDAPGDVVPVEEIIAAAWPGERIRPDAALNRAYVALATLRKLGLRDVLVTGAGGYCLDPAVAVRLASREESETAAG